MGKISSIKAAGIGSFGAIVIGLILALYGVQGWKMPTALAVVLLSILFVLLALSIGMLCVAAFKAIKQFMENRATSAAWISTEVPGLLDYEADSERDSKRFNKELKQLTIDTVRLGKTLTLQSKQMRDLNKSGKAIKGTEKQKRGNRAGKVIDRSALYIEKRIELFKVLINDMDRNYNGLIAATRINTEEDRAVVARFATVLESARKSTSASIISIKSYRDSVRLVEKQNLSRAVRIASNRLGNGLDNIIELFNQLQELHTELTRKIANTDSPIPDK